MAKRRHRPSAKTKVAPPARAPRLLWANPFCLLDTASGASMSVREMLRQLAGRGYEIQILGATIFDAEKGTTRLRDHWRTIEESQGKVVNIEDGPLMHRLVVTANVARNAMTVGEQGIWFAVYNRILDDFKPDLVWFYGGQTLDLLIPQEARVRGIPSAAYLVNGNYAGERWCRDVDLILTDSRATAEHYTETQGYRPVPVGAFIEPGPVVASQHSRERILFINPSLQKGAAVVIQLALLLERRRPDLVFEVVESRGNWPALVRSITAKLGEPREALANLVVTPNTADMRPIYGRARLLLAPSLWWESGARVLAEAMMNGIPAIVSNLGGSPEMVGDGGIKVTFPPKCHESPYTTFPTPEVLEPLVQIIERLFDDEAGYQALAQRALRVGQTLHGLEASTGRLIAALDPLIRQRAGDRDHVHALESVHKQGVALRPPAADEVRALLTQAVEALGQNRLVQAAQSGERLLTLAPRDPTVAELVGTIRQRQGRLPEAIAQYREGLRLMLARPIASPTKPPSAPTFDQVAHEALLWKTLARLAERGVHAFPTSGTLLGLIRDGALLPFDKDVDVGLPFAEMETAIACLRADGWQEDKHSHGLINPRALRHRASGLFMDLCGFLVEPETGITVSGFWVRDIARDWQRITEFPAMRLRQRQRPEGLVWELSAPETWLKALYGEQWRTPDPDFDTVVAAYNLRGFALLTQCYALLRILDGWRVGRLAKVLATVGHARRHVPEDDLLVQVESHLRRLSMTDRHHDSVGVDAV